MALSREKLFEKTSKHSWVCKASSLVGAKTKTIGPSPFSNSGCASKTFGAGWDSQTWATHRLRLLHWCAQWPAARTPESFRTPSLQCRPHIEKGFWEIHADIVQKAYLLYIMIIIIIIIIIINSIIQKYVKQWFANWQTKRASEQPCLCQKAQLAILAPELACSVRLGWSTNSFRYCWWLRTPKQPPGMVLKPWKNNGIN